MDQARDRVRVCSTQIPSIQRLLESWTDTVLRYCHTQKYDDNPWWYNERATLSTLAAAAWRMGWVALEEFATEKRRGDVPEGNRDDGESKNGRCDLYIGRPTEKGSDFAIEAKQAWQSIGPKGSRTSDMMRVRAAAWKDASKLDRYEAKVRLAVTFVVPFVPASCVRKPGIEPLLSSWFELDPFSKKRTPAARAPLAWACVFPAKAHCFKNDRGRVYPGVGLVAELRQKAARITRTK